MSTAQLQHTCDIFRDLGQRERLAYALIGLTSAHREAGDLAEAAEAGAQALARAAP